MIAITNPGPYAGLPTVTAPETITLTPTIINEIPANIIGNATITGLVKNMLLKIRENPLVTAEAHTRLAEYAGIIRNANNSIGYSSENASLDKLTFYVMFRLPDPDKGLPYSNIGNGNTSASVSSDPATWGLYANHIRNSSGSGIKKINSAGEQVNSQNKPVDNSDPNNILEGWYNEKAYNFLGEKPFNENYDIPTGLNSAQTEKAMLFGQYEEQPDSPNNGSEITQIPLHFYLLAKAENSYSNAYWLNANYNDTRISRIPHWPASLKNKIYRKHFVKLFRPNVPSLPNIIQNIEEIPYYESYRLEMYQFPDPFYSEVCFKVNTGTSGIKYAFVQALDYESLSFENLTLTEATEVERTDDGLLVTWKSKYDYPQLTKYSGLTIGMGVDIGASLHGIYEIKINITISGSGTFRLYSGGNRSEEINTNITCKKLKEIISALTGVILDRIKVLDNSNDTTGIPNKILITRKNGALEKAYNHRIYVGDLTGTAQVLLTPSSETDRWVEINTSLIDDWYYFNRYMNYSVSNRQQQGNYWMSQFNLSEQEKINLNRILKMFLGCQEGSAYHLWDENKALLKKIELKSYVRNLRSTYHKYYKERYYNRRRQLSDGSVAFNGVNVSSFLAHEKLKMDPNQAELFAIDLYIYNYPYAFNQSAVQNQLIKAINRHSITDLLIAIKMKNSEDEHYMSGDRIRALENFLGREKVKENLYHNLD